MKRTVAGLGLALLLSGLAPGQTSNATTEAPVDPKARFEVADVHGSAPGAQQSGGYMGGDRFEARAFTMLDLLEQAYGMDRGLILGGPAWLSTDKFDIVAKLPVAKAGYDLVQVMLRNLLTERFQLALRKESKSMPVYVLTVAKKGAKLQPAAQEGPPNTSRGTTDPVLNNHIVCHSFKMSDLVEMLPMSARNFIDHPMVDETGLKGAYDFELSWMGRGIYNRAKATPDGPPAVGVFDALDKLGLKADPGMRPLEVLTVVSVNETPTPNAPGVGVPKPTYPTEFEVAEVRPAKDAPAPGTGIYGQMRFQNGRVELMGTTLIAIIADVLDHPIDRIVGAPKWMSEDRFDIIAKAPATAPFEALQAMVKNLLEQRFQLQTHTEDQPMPVFVLLAGKKPKLKPSDGTARSECKPVLKENQIDGTYACQNTTMAQFAERLPLQARAYLRPPMLDLTGIQGAHDFELSWTSKKFLSNGGRGGSGSDGNAPAQASTPLPDVTVFEALDKQLGLKAEEQKHPIPVLVIDHVNQKPTEN